MPDEQLPHLPSDSEIEMLNYFTSPDDVFKGEKQWTPEVVRAQLRDSKYIKLQEGIMVDTMSLTDDGKRWLIDRNARIKRDFEANKPDNSLERQARLEEIRRVHGLSSPRQKDHPQH